MFTASFSTVLRKAIVGKMEPMQMEVVAGFMHVLISVFAYFVTGTKYKNVTPMIWGMVVFQSILGFLTVFAFTCAVRGENNLGAASAIVSASPLITLFLSCVFYGEKVDLRMIFGILMILVGTTILSIRK